MKVETLCRGYAPCISQEPYVPGCLLSSRLIRFPTRCPLDSGTTGHWTGGKGRDHSGDRGSTL